MNANSIDLSGRTAVVTGGARGIGLACARRILASGCRVSLWDRDATALAQAAATLAAPGKVGTVTVDVADEAAVASAASATQADMGRVDILINNAGISGPNQTTWDYEPAEWR